MGGGDTLPPALCFVPSDINSSFAPWGPSGRHERAGLRGLSVVPSILRLVNNQFLFRLLSKTRIFYKSSQNNSFPLRAPVTQLSSLLWWFLFVKSFVLLVFFVAIALLPFVVFLKSLLVSSCGSRTFTLS